MTTYEELFKNGCLVDLDIHEWQPRTRLRPKEIGIPDTPAVREALNLPTIRLLSRKQLYKITWTSTEARRVLDQHSINFPIRGVRFVPYTIYPDLHASLRAICAQRDAAVAELQLGYAKIRQDGMDMAREAIREATNDPAVVEMAMIRLESKYPKHDDLWRLYRMEWKPIALATPSTGDVARHVNQCVEGMIGSLREELATRIAHVADLLSTGAKIKTTTVEASRRLCERLRTLNILGDQGLMDAVANFDSLIDQAVSGEPLALKYEFLSIEKELEQSASEAIENAKQALTGLGRRKIIA